MESDQLRCKLFPSPSPSVKSVGITGQLTGSRADLMVLDDIEVPGNSMTELMREKLLQLCTEAESILTPKNDSRILFLGTPQTTFTVYRKLAESVTTAHLFGLLGTRETLVCTKNTLALSVAGGH